MKKILVIITLSSLAFWANAQNQKITFNGVARGNINNNWLPETDTNNVDQSLNGNTLIDLRMDIHPSDKIRIKTDLRFGNPMGGFWGQGATIQLRHLSIKGVAGNFLKYRFGDIDLKMTPYTLYNNVGELSKNEADIFKFTREINEEENYNFGNYWHQQGADLAFRLGFDKLIESADVSGFVVRNRSIVGNIVPDRLHAGGYTKININKKSFIGFNYINLFDVPKTVNNSYTAKFSNEVYTSNFKFDFNALYLFGEGGYSREQFTDTSNVQIIDIAGDFFEVGAGKKLLGGQLSIEASYRRVSDDFYSAGAQSKRINMGASPTVLPVVSEEMNARSAGLLDIVSDPSIYNPTITNNFQTAFFQYNPVSPYGKATPNRKGLDLEIAYTDSANKYATSLSAEIMQNVRGEGTEELRNYKLINWNGEIAFDKIFDLEKTIKLNGGIQYGNCQRDGKSIVPDVDYTSKAIDAGLVIELVQRLDFLMGTKMLYAQGTEYSSTINEFNQITDYKLINSNVTEQLNAVGIRYRFNDNITFTVQGNNYSVKFPDQNTADYSINQLFMLFNMKF